MGSKGIASIIILILSIIFFTTPSSAQAPTASPPTPTCPPLQACVGLLPVLGNIGVGVPQSQPCCSIISGLVDADALVCVCAVVKANVVGIDINVPVKELLK
ncbi:proline-rich protein DC2.15, partial [Trifolium medium]|nr:proline-rich protein DC2.15 [Trifolium medium]